MVSSAEECERVERATYGDPDEWRRHQPRQPSIHREHSQFGTWVDRAPGRVTDEPSNVCSLVSARALAPSMLEPAVPAKLAELSVRYSGDGAPVQLEPFANVPRGKLKPLTRAERRKLRSVEERYSESMQLTDAAMKRWAAQWRELGESVAHLPPTACPETYAMCRAVVCSREAADAALGLIGSSYGGNVLYRVQRSAFGFEDAPQWDTRSLCGRRQIALDLFMLRQSRLKLAGRDKYGKPIMQPCVWGIGRGYLQALLAHPETHQPLSRERLTHSNDSSAGMFHKAEASGVFLRQSKIPPEVADHDEIGPTGYTFNRYWVARAHNPKRGLRAEPDGIDHEESNTRGWQWLDRGVRAALRGRFLKALASVDRKWVARELKATAAPAEQPDPPE